MGMTESVTFQPLFPEWLLITLGLVGAILLAVGLIQRHRGMVLRSLALSALLLALLDPALQREDREQLSSVAAIVVDKSESQDLGNRSLETENIVADLKGRLERLNNIDVRIVESGSRDKRRDDGTVLFSALNNALSDVPPDRVAGAILVTDGQVHDIPQKAHNLGFSAPLHVLVTGSPDERDRQLVLHRAPRFGLIDTDQVVTLRVRDHGIENAGRVNIQVKRDGEFLLQERVQPGATIDHSRTDFPCRIEYLRI